MKQEIVLYCSDFKPKQEYLDFIKSLGYDDYKDLNCRIDLKVINFIKEKATRSNSGYHMYIGDKAKDRMIGYYGFAYIENVDINREFRLIYSDKKFTFVGLHEDIKYKDEEPVYNYHIIRKE